MSTKYSTIHYRKWHESFTAKAQDNVFQETRNVVGLHKCTSVMKFLENMEKKLISSF